MKTNHKSVILIFSGAVVIYLFISLNSSDPSIEVFSERNHFPQIDPDYTETVIPPNIAPLNFNINEKGTEFFVDIYVKNSESNHIKISSKKHKIKIPIKKWKNILSSNRGKELYIDIYLKNTLNEWEKFRTIKNTIAEEEIDSHVAYRLINPAHVLWWEMGIYQRNIENFNESVIFTNRVSKKNCMNCHSFSMNNPEIMMFHIRGDLGGTMLIKDGNVTKINTGTEYTMSAGVYPAWHPNGNLIAFSVNKINQFFHSQQDKTIFVRDSASDIIIYNIQTNTITTTPKISTSRLENLPTWSPDGKYLYFISGPEWTEKKKYSELKYDLMRISYDIETNHWGELDTILTTAETGESISFPKISPDGKYVLFCMSDYGYFTIHFRSSDLYMFDLRTNKYWKLDVNSEDVESYHSWSSNSRWFVFSSKRKDGLCSRLYFSYVDSNGDAYKPFLMPQKDPDFYKTFIKNYNIPELIDGPVTVNHWKLAQVAREVPIQAEFDSTVNIDALSGATKIVKTQ